jgi:hypothetical protein
LPAATVVKITGLLSWGVLAVAMGACKSAEAREAERLDKALSFTATAGSVARAWADNRVPTRYAERTLSEAQEGLIDTQEPDAARIAETLRAAVHAGDRRAVSKPLASLMSRWSALHRNAEARKSSGE